MLLVSIKLLLALGACAVVAIRLPLVVADDDPLAEIDPESSSFARISVPPSSLNSQSQPPSLAMAEEAATTPAVTKKCLKYNNVDILDRKAVEAENGFDQATCKNERDHCYRLLSYDKITMVTNATAGCMSYHEHNTTMFFDTRIAKQLVNGLGCLTDRTNFIYHKMPKRHSEYVGVTGEVKQLCISTSADIESQKLIVLPDSHECYLYSDADYHPLSDGAKLSTAKCFTTYRDIYAKGNSVVPMCYRGARIVDGKAKLYGGCVDAKRSCEELEEDRWIPWFFEKVPRAYDSLPTMVSCCSGNLCNKELDPASISCSAYTNVNIFNATAVEETNKVGAVACPSGKFCYQYIQQKDDVLYATAGCATDVSKYPTPKTDDHGCYTADDTGAAATALGIDKATTTSICTGFSPTNVFTIDERNLPTCYSYNIRVAHGSAASGVPKAVHCYTSYGEKEKRVNDTKHYCYSAVAMDENNNAYYSGGCVDRPQRCEAGGDDGINMTATEKGRIEWFFDMLKFKEEGSGSHTPEVVQCCATTLGGEPCNGQLALPRSRSSTTSTVSLALVSIVVAISTLAAAL
uniref:Uncharacterized protein n=1 Tax=Plectus sambesii TaxID=2011161 RepID=A0A914WDK3_9BILA